MFELIKTLKIQQILDLGFECLYKNHLYLLIDNSKTVLRISWQDKDVCFVGDDGIYNNKAANMIIDMVNKGYITKGKNK